MRRNVQKNASPDRPDSSESPIAAARFNGFAIDVILICVTFVVSLGMLWPGIPDPLTDYGRELYVAWQVSAGRSLYHDIAYYQGPLAPQVNATLFQVFGVSARVILVFNVLMAAGVVGMLYELVRRMAGRVSAVVTAVLFCIIFGFSQLLISGNYNFLTPYSHDLTYGFALSLGTLLAVEASVRSGSGKRSTVMAGVAGFLFDWSC